MRRLIQHTIATITVSFTLLIASPIHVAAQTDPEVVKRPIPLGATDRALDFARTELFFGTAKPTGVVTEDEFFAFLDEHITPRFPDGLTVLKGDGQFRGANGLIVKEDSFLLILLYPLETFRDSNRKINTIRRLYMKEFQQESVLRVDDPFAARVSF